MTLATAVYDATFSFPKAEIYGLTSQMRRAAVSVPSNIAEGSGRATRRDFRSFVVIALGSACELQTQMLLAERLGYLDAARAQALVKDATEIHKMLHGLSAYLLRVPVRQAGPGTHVPN